MDIKLIESIDVEQEIQDTKSRIQTSANLIKTLSTKINDEDGIKDCLKLAKDQDFEIKWLNHLNGLHLGGF